MDLKGDHTVSTVLGAHFCSMNVAALLEAKLPAGTWLYVEQWMQVKGHELHVQLVAARKTKLGDYRTVGPGKHLITVNADLNPYQLLVTLVHELAHMHQFIRFPLSKAHGVEWKSIFKEMLFTIVFIESLPADVRMAITTHMQNPKACSGSDIQLARSLRKHDEPATKPLYAIETLPPGTLFRFKRHRVLQLHGLRRKRYTCIEPKTGLRWLFHPLAEVEVVRWPEPTLF